MKEQIIKISDLVYTDRNFQEPDPSSTEYKEIIGIIFEEFNKSKHESKFNEKPLFFETGFKLYL